MTHPQQGSDVCAPVQRLVEEVLNGPSLHLLPSVVSELFVDDDRILGLPPGSRGLLRLIQFLAQPGVDIRFTIESLMSDGALVAARIFGEGIVQRPALTRLGPAPELRGVHRLHVQVTTVSMFRVQDGQIVRRWGPVSIERAVFS